MEYNEIIRALREDKDLTQGELGKKFNVNQITISQYERGIRQLPIEILKKYAMYFNVSTDYILGLTEEPKPSYNPKNKIDIKNNYGKINIK